MDKKDIVLIVCASATSWMLSKVVHNKGGLYNRLTEQINLHTFSLHECEEYVQSMGLVLNREHVAQIKRKLGISGVLTEVNSWYCKADPDKGIFGSRIDMLITTYGLVENSYAANVQSVVVMDDLFAPN